MAQPIEVVMRQLADAKSSEGIFELPCGYIDPATNELHKEVKVREMTGAEEDLLASKSTPLNRKMNELLLRCVERIGTIDNRERLANAILDLTTGDRFFLMFAIRRVSLGDLYPFKENCPSCKEESLYQIGIGELDIKAMPDPKKRIYDVALPSGKKARIRITSGRDEERLAKAAKSDDALSIAIQMRVESLDGSPPTLGDLKTMGTKDRDFLRTQFEEIEGGVDTGLEMVCPKCSHEFDGELNVGQAGFFFPSAMSRRSKKKSSI